MFIDFKDGGGFPKMDDMLKQVSQPLTAADPQRNESGEEGMEGPIVCGPAPMQKPSEENDMTTQAYPEEG